MAERRTAEQIERLLKEAGRDLARGLTSECVCRKPGIPRASCYRWRRRAAAAAPAAEARRLKELQSEVERLKLLVADLMLDKVMLQEVAKKKW
jgi:putative transposase